MRRIGRVAGHGQGHLVPRQPVGMGGHVTTQDPVRGEQSRTTAKQAREGDDGQATGGLDPADDREQTRVGQAQLRVALDESVRG